MQTNVSKCKQMQIIPRQSKQMQANASKYKQMQANTNKFKEKEEGRRRATGGLTEEEVLSAVWWETKNEPKWNPKRGPTQPARAPGGPEASSKKKTMRPSARALARTKILHQAPLLSPTESAPRPQNKQPSCRQVQSSQPAPTQQNTRNSPKKLP